MCGVSDSSKVSFWGFLVTVDFLGVLWSVSFSPEVESLFFFLTDPLEIQWDRFTTFPEKIVILAQVLDTRDYDLNLCKISVFFTAKLTNRMIARLQPFIQSRELEVSYLMLSKFCADRCMWKPRIFLFSVRSNFSPFGNLHGQSLLLKLYL